MMGIDNPQLKIDTTYRGTHGGHHGREIKDVDRLISQRQAALVLGVRHGTIGDLVRARGIATYPMESVGRGKGIDRRGLLELRRILKRTGLATAGPPEG